MATTTKRPSIQTIHNLENTIIQRLFNKRYRSSIIRYNTDDIITPLHYVPRHSPHIPEPIQMPWGDALRTLSSPKSVLSKFGTRGEATQQHNKQAMLYTGGPPGNIKYRKHGVIAGIVLIVSILVVVDRLPLQVNIQNCRVFLHLHHVMYYD